MAFAASGTIVSTTTTTLTVNPAATGNLFIVEVVSESGTIWCTSISGGNCTWVQAGTAFTGVATVFTTTVFLGTATGTGSASATLTFNGATPTIRCAGQQFTSTTGAWAVDGTQGNLDADTLNLPVLTPAAAGDLYFCYDYIGGAGTTAGATSGYTYQADANSNLLTYNTACTSSAQAPTLGGTSNPLFGAAILLTEVSSSAGISPVLPGQTWLRRFRHRQVISRAPAPPVSATAGLASAAGAARQPFAGPSGTFTISAGGTYGPAQIGTTRICDQTVAGSPTSTNISTGMAVYVNTTSPVIIDGQGVMTLVSNAGGVLCLYAIPGAQLTIRNCYFDAYLSNGFAIWIDATNAAKPALTFENNQVHGGTMVIANGGGQGQLTSCTIRYNIFLDLYARLTTWPSGPLQQFLSFRNIYGPGIEIAWNQFLNRYGTSALDDIWSFYADPDLRCGGTLASRAQFHDNMLDGGYPSPLATSSSGSGGIIDLYGGQYGAFCDMHDNQYVAMCQSGPAIESGHATTITNNRICSSGRKPDNSGYAPGLNTNGNAVDAYSGTDLGSSVTAWDGTDAGAGWGSVSITNNVLGFIRPDGSRADSFIENAAWDPVTTSGNLHFDATSSNLANPWNTGSASTTSYTITVIDEANERTRWLSKVATAGVTIGPQTLSTSAPAGLATGTGVASAAGQANPAAATGAGASQQPAGHNARLATGAGMARDVLKPAKDISVTIGPTVTRALGTAGPVTSRSLAAGAGPVQGDGKTIGPVQGDGKTIGPSIVNRGA